MARLRWGGLANPANKPRLAGVEDIRDVDYLRAIAAGQDADGDDVIVSVTIADTTVPVSGTVSVSEPVTVDGTVSVSEPVTVDGGVYLVGDDPLDASGTFMRERVTSAFPVITTDHGFIHEGIAFTYSGVFTVSTSYSIAFTTPADKYIHFKPTGISASGGPVTVTLVEGATIEGGSTGTAYNRNRLSSVTSGVAIKYGVTPSGGTAIATLYIPSSTSGSQKLGASAASAEEHVLKRSTVYLLKFDEAATGDVTVGADVFWYEEAGA